jgi:hypothetical protein
MSEARLQELSTPEAVKKAGQNLASTAIKAVNLTGFEISYWHDVKIADTYFLGCQFDTPEIPSLLARKGATIVPQFTGRPYEVFRYSLYTSEELLHKLASGVTVDQTIYCNYLSKGKFSPDIVEALCRRIHDDGID